MLSSFAGDYTTQFQSANQLVTRCETKRSFLEWTKFTCTFTSARHFKVHLSGLSGAQPREAAIRPLLTPQLDKAASAFILDWMNALYRHFPQTSKWVPRDVGANAKFCMVQNQCD